MTSALSSDKEITNTAIEPILTRALHRFRALLPREVELVIDLISDELRVRTYPKQLEDALLSACLIAWQSMGPTATQIIVEMKDVLLDDIVLDPQAEQLQGGIPPRNYAWLVVSNSTRMQAGPFATLIPPPKLMDDNHGSAKRYKLSEIRDVIELHHGWVTATPETGKGTAFEIFLPTARQLEIPATNESGSGVKHIIYVDDYDAMRDLVSETLPDGGFEVSCFEGGKAAFEALQASPSKYAAVVSDYKLQGYSGIDLLHQVKRYHPHLPVVIISGYVDDHLRSLAMTEGASLVISKTSDLGDLCTALRSLLAAAPNPSLTTYTDWAQI